MKAAKEAEATRFPPLPPQPQVKGAKGKKGGGKGHGKDQNNTQVCFSWSNGNGSCGGMPPHSTCPFGRAHKCQICLSAAHQAAACPSA
eukprot:11682668-Heterocapsa_arctica.AAC.1